MYGFGGVRCEMHTECVVGVTQVGRSWPVLAQPAFFLLTLFLQILLIVLPKPICKAAHSLSIVERRSRLGRIEALATCNLNDYYSVPGPSSPIHWQVPPTLDLEVCTSSGAHNLGDSYVVDQ